MSGEEVERVKAPIDTVLLDDIARGIADVKHLLEAQVPEGQEHRTAGGLAGQRPRDRFVGRPQPRWPAGSGMGGLFPARPAGSVERGRAPGQIEIHSYLLF